MKYNEQILGGIEYMKGTGLGKKATSVWGAVFENGTTLKCDHTQCFGATRQDQYLGCKWIVSRIQDNGAAGTGDFEPDLEEYYEWLFNESPWAKVFVSDSGKQAVEERWLVIRTDVPSNLMMGALQASRIPTEHSNPMFVMNDLHKAGVSRNLGFLIGMCLLGGDMRKGSAKWGDTTREHTCLSSGNLDAGTMQNFINGTPPNLNKLYVDKVEYASPFRVNDLWGERKGTRLVDYLNKNFDAEAILAGEVEETVCLNPFKKVDHVPQAGVVSYTDAIKAMALFYPNIIKDFNLDV